jgi:hypothetical protein
MVDEALHFLALTFRLGLPVGPIYPYALASAGYFKDYGNGGGGAVGLGLEWQLGTRMALAADVRAHRGTGNPSPPALWTGTAGLAARW